MKKGLVQIKFKDKNDFFSYTLAKIRDNVVINEVKRLVKIGTV